MDAKRIARYAVLGIAVALLAGSASSPPPRAESPHLPGRIYVANES